MSARLSELIGEVVADPAAELVRAYFDESKSFAGSTFDLLPNNDPPRFTAEDLVAVSLLDVRFEPRAVRRLLGDPDGTLRRQLALIRTDLDLWDASDEQLAPAYELWSAVKALPGVGRTRTSKLLARKRPRLMPVLDSVIDEALPLRPDAWILLRDALREPGLRQSIDALRSSGVPREISTLRLVDVATWMRFSRSENARAERRGLGVQEPEE